MAFQCSVPVEMIPCTKSLVYIVLEGGFSYLERNRSILLIIVFVMLLWKVKIQIVYSRTKCIDHSPNMTLYKGKPYVSVFLIL